MAKLEVKIYPDPVLRKKAEEVKELTEEIKNLGWDMVETLEVNDGVGLAAPQVGVSKRVIIVQTEKGPVILVNPKIIKKSREKETMEEGCLSLPGIWLKIKRAKKVEAVAIDKEGKKIKINTEGLSARILQHEIDHLNGILIIDRINLFQKLLFKLRK
ncbi:MAG: peptide deformylase [Candidatus Nealsonbacteria bacterium]|nr:MAG: peptide deformylase [Candidatus Nealsonbacteria bacterium]